MKERTAGNIPALTSLVIGTIFVIISVLIVIPPSSLFPEKEFKPESKSLDNYVFNNYGGKDAAIIDRLRKNLDSLTISQEKTGCLGSCPSYELVIYGNGTVSYNGYGYVKPKGSFTFTVSDSVIDELITEFDKTDFVTLKDTYGRSSEDAPYNITIISLDGKQVKRIVFQSVVSVPAEVLYMQDKIEKVVRIELE